MTVRKCINMLLVLQVLALLKFGIAKIDVDAQQADE